MMNELQIGSVIKSRDFSGNDSYFIIGKVLSYNTETGEIKCKGIIQVWDNELQDECLDEFYTVMNGCLPFDSYGDRITVLA